MKLKGVDISEHNGVVNFAELKKHVDFVIIRVGYGLLDQGGMDKQFKRNVEECIKHNIPYGFYHFLYPYNKERAIKEADSLLKVIKGYKPSYPVYADFEYEGRDWIESNVGIKVTKEVATNGVRNYLSRVESGGYYVGNYTNIDWLNNYYDNSLLKDYDVWVADWRGIGVPKVAKRMWQYTSDGRVPGINGRVDMNECYYDYPKVIKTAGLNGHKNVTSKSNSEKAIDGIKKVLKDYGY